MDPWGTRDTARVRRSFFAIAVVTGLGSTLVVGVTIGAHSSTAPSHLRAQDSASRTAAVRAAPTTAPAAEGPAAKASAEAALAGNPAADAPPPQPLVVHAAKTPTTQVVQYHGYQVQVPGSWPVYSLATDPSQCVLFNTHAVYLGTPGSAQDCPAHAFGHTESLLIQPASQASVPSSAIVLPAATAALSEHATLPAGAVTGDVIQVEAPGPGVLITAAYGTDEASIRAILAGATMTTTTSATTANTTTSATQGLMATGAEALTGQAAAAKPSQLTGMTGSGLGFDTCTVPSTATMSAWQASPYRVVATYLGGANWACDYGNFSASWVSQVAAEGWRFMPLWVGRQAPCTGLSYVATINPSQAAAEGQAEAASAVAAARAFGYGTGTPIYFDMEAYATSNRACSSAVLSFLGGWTRALHAAGYVSGVYSSAASGIRDLAGQYHNSGYPRPDDIWIADWNSEPVLTDTAVPNADWAAHQRLHQYSGPHEETWGGATLQIDSDAVDGLVAGLPAAPVVRGPVETAVPSELTVAPGRTATVQLTLRGVPNTQASVHWQVTAPSGLAVTPGQGSVDLPPGAVFSVPLTLAPSKSLAARRYDVPVTVTAGSQPVATTFVLVSVVAAGKALPTAYPLVLYAADPASMTAAVAIAQALALPPADVTGSFSHAWAATAAGHDLVLAVGEAAANALYLNACGWANPAKTHGGSTPFYYLGEPQQRLPGRNYFELADVSTAAGTAQLTTQLTQYALAGTLPNAGSTPPAPAPPALTCLGSPNVRVS
jgi:hypothetical protein